MCGHTHTYLLDGSCDSLGCVCDTVIECPHDYTCPHGCLVVQTPHTSLFSHHQPGWKWDPFGMNRGFTPSLAGDSSRSHITFFCHVASSFCSSGSSKYIACTQWVGRWSGESDLEMYLEVLTL